MAKSNNRDARLAEALRENLRRRKAGRTEGATEPAPERDNGERENDAPQAPRPNPAAKNT